MAEKMEILQETRIRQLAALALEARSRSYCPYSGFAVGASLLAGDGRIFSGCNIENSSFTPTICAERTAIFKAISEGCTEFEAIAVAGGAKEAAPTDYCPPCGVCRQVMSEFCSPEFEIFLVKSEKEIRRVTLRDLLPMMFENLKPTD